MSNSDQPRPVRDWYGVAGFVCAGCARTGLGPVLVLFSTKPAHSGAATGGISCTITVDGKRADQESNPTGVQCAANMNR